MFCKKKWFSSLKFLLFFFKTFSTSTMFFIKPVPQEKPVNVDGARSRRAVELSRGSAAASHNLLQDVWT